MTRKQFRAKVREVKRNNNRLLDECVEKILSSGCIELSKYEDNFVLPRIFIYAFTEEMKFQWKLHSAEALKEAKNMVHFM